MEERMEVGVVSVCEGGGGGGRRGGGGDDGEESRWEQRSDTLLAVSLMKVLIMERVTFQPVTGPVSLIDPL